VDGAEALLGWAHRQGAVIGAGLDDDELAAAEAAYGVTFPPLWRRTLALGLPAGERWPRWRDLDDDTTCAQVGWPVRGVLFDVEGNDFWWPGWGVRPDTPDERLAVARAELATVPRLAPLHGHRYVGPGDDTPVFSIWQTDLYVPALTLATLPTGPDEEHLPRSAYPIGDVPFWSALHAWSQWPED
jgi:hypothetical protein